MDILVTDFNTQRALRKRNYVAKGFVMKVLWQDHTFVMKFTLNALCLMKQSYSEVKWYTACQAVKAVHHPVVTNQAKLAEFTWFVRWARN